MSFILSKYYHSREKYYISLLSFSSSFLCGISDSIFKQSTFYHICLLNHIHYNYGHQLMPGLLSQPGLQMSYLSSHAMTHTPAIMDHKTHRMSIKIMSGPKNKHGGSPDLPVPTSNVTFLNESPFLLFTMNLTF